MLFYAFVAPAQAAQVHTLLSSKLLPENAYLSSLAINQKTHHIYMVSSRADGERTVFNLGPDGEPDPVLPELPGVSALGPFYASVDNSGGANDGDIYVSIFSGGSGGIQQYDPSGSPTVVKITSSAIPPNGTVQGGGLAPVVNNGGFIPQATTVAPSGNVFAYDSENRAIDEFTPAGAFVAQLAQGSFVISGLAVDTGGNIYVAGHNIPLGRPLALYELNPAGECVPASCDPVAAEWAQFTGGVADVAVDHSTGRIFVAGMSLEEEGEFSEFDSSGALLGATILPSSAEGELYFPSAIAIDESSGDLIVGAGTGQHREGAVQIYGPAETVPDVETEGADSVTDHSAAFHGKVGAAEGPDATCAFQYVDDASFKRSGFRGAAAVPCEPAGPFSGSAMNAVHAEVTGLVGGTTYHARLLGTNENGSNPGEDFPFTTKGPSTSEAEASQITETSATLSGVVDPHGVETTYAFQYVTQEQFEASGYAEATSVPAPPAVVALQTLGSGDLREGSTTVKNAVATEGAFLVGQSIEGEGIPAETKIVSVEGEELTLSRNASESLGSVALTATGNQPVSQALSGLTPDTLYHFRIAATSTGGETVSSSFGEDRTFSTYPPPSVGLPDGRAYEQASPVQKNGLNVQGEAHAVQAASDGDRITFNSLTGIPGGEGQQTFPSYVASRASNGGGWSTLGMLPSASYGRYAAVIGWDEELAGVYDFASVPGVSTSLLARSSADGSMSEIAQVPGGHVGTPFYFAGASATGEVALLESRRGGVLPGDLAGKQNVYAYDRETGDLVLAGVMNDGSASPEGAMGGPYAWTGALNPNEGRGASYYTQPNHAISTDGRRIFFTAGTGQLYVRQNPLAAQSQMNGEECTEAATKACTIRVSAPEEGVTDPGTNAAFAWASANGSIVYFLDKGRLTADSTAGVGYDLYRYDLESGQLTDLTVDTTDGHGAQVMGVLGVGADGGDAYFVAAGALVDEAEKAPQGETNLYALHGEEVMFIARLATDEIGEANWIPTGTGGGGVLLPRTGRVSGNGQALLFTSRRQVTSYRNHGKAELYLYRTGREVQCVSCNPTQEAPRGGAGVQNIPKPGVSANHNMAIMTRNLSADGRRVIFDSPDQLVSADENDVNDVYEWEEDGKGSCQSEAQDGGCIFLISSGTGSDPSYFGDADKEGNNVFFFTTSQLVAQDRDQLVDVYDARVGGGIAAQNQRPAPPCEGESCLGPGSSGQAGQTPGTSTFSGPGNPSATRPPACAKGRTRKHGRCVKPGHAKKKKHAKKKHHKQRRAQRAKGGSGR